MLLIYTLRIRYRGPSRRCEPSISLRLVEFRRPGFSPASDGPASQSHPSTAHAGSLTQPSHSIAKASRFQRGASRGDRLQRCPGLISILVFLTLLPFARSLSRLSIPLSGRRAAVGSRSSTPTYIAATSATNVWTTTRAAAWWPDKETSANIKTDPPLARRGPASPSLDFFPLQHVPFLVLFPKASTIIACPRLSVIFVCRSPKHPPFHAIILGGPVLLAKRIPTSHAKDHMVPN